MAVLIVIAVGEGAFRASPCDMRGARARQRMLVRAARGGARVRDSAAALVSRRTRRARRTLTAPLPPPAGAGNDYQKDLQFRKLNAVKDVIEVKVVRGGEVKVGLSGKRRALAGHARRIGGHARNACCAVCRPGTAPDRLR